MDVYIEKLFNRAIFFHKNGDFKQALKFYYKILKFKPNHKLTLINISNIYDQTGNLIKAKFFFEKLLLLDCQNEEVIFKLGIIYFRLNDLKNCLLIFEKLIDINPNFINLKYNLFLIVKSSLFLNFKDINEKVLEKILLFLFHSNEIDHSAISDLGLNFLINTDDLDKYLNQKQILSFYFIQNFIKNELFHLILQKTIITQKNLEKILTLIRKEFFLNMESISEFNSLQYQNFLISLAEQSWLNEYVWFIDNEEFIKIEILKNKIEKDIEINEEEIVLLACYFQLNNSEIIKKKLLNYKSENILFNNLINLLIIEPEKELELKSNIKSFSLINNLVSKEVRDQYEKNPYPRWRYSNQLRQIDFNNDLNFQIKPNKFFFQKPLDKINILLAGCGTGKHIFNVAKFKNSKVLAVDLSLSSLAYAKRKINESDYQNVEFLQSDILNLEQLNKIFDIIHCVGTLHHMEKPMDGLKVLTNILSRNGVIKIGLYSEIARNEILKVKEVIKNKRFLNNVNDIRSFRKFILAENNSSNLYSSIFNRDFYSISNIKDLFFHAKEHHFTISKIKQFLEDFNLDFLGFVFSNDLIKKKYSKIFPGDKNLLNLDNWHYFEIENTNTFINMYQFFVKKR